jgi:hypothetical protein
MTDLNTSLQEPTGTLEAGKSQIEKEAAEGLDPARTGAALLPAEAADSRESSHAKR